VPSGPAGGVLSGTYPNPGFAQAMATQAELGTTFGATSLVGGVPTITFGSVWGIDGTTGQPYYDPNGAASGEDALLIVDTNGSLNLVQPVGTTP
jgi:hypothetical protein